jgi:hypothetical protein
VTLLAGITGLSGFVWLAVFQVLLALGLPLGAMAWGGTHRVLPGRLRVASVVSAGLAVLGAVTVAQGSGLGPAVLPDIFMPRRRFWASVGVALFAGGLSFRGSPGNAAIAKAGAM